jgi:hypothetical protein
LAVAVSVAACSGHKLLLLVVRLTLQATSGCTLWLADLLAFGAAMVLCRALFDTMLGFELGLGTGAALALSGARAIMLMALTMVAESIL